MTESSESQKEYNRVSEFLLKPGFNFEFRHALCTVYALKDLQNDNIRKKDAILTRFAQEASFLSIFSLFYDRYRFVRRSEMYGRKKWYLKQLKELGYLMLLDLFHPEKAIPSAAEAKSKNESWVPIQNFPRIRSKNRELFFSTPKPAVKNSGCRRRADKRFSFFSTIFSELPKTEESDREAALLLLSAPAMAANASMTQEEIEQRKELMAGLRMVDPEDIIGMENFWDITKQSLEVLTLNYGQPTNNAWLLPHIKKGSIVVEGMYQFIDKAIALRWYRTFKSEDRKADFFKEKHPIRYSKRDAEKAISANSRWFGDTTQVVDLVFRGADAFSHMGKLSVSVILYRECLNQLTLDDKDRGLCYHNIAIAYRDMGKQKSYLGYLMKALAIFEKVGPFDVGITLANIAEAYALSKKPLKYEEAKNKAMVILAKGGLTSGQQASAFLQVADCAAISKDETWEKEALNLALDASIKVDNLDAASYLIQRIGDLEHGRNTLIAERESGKIKRPAIFPWLKEPHRYVAITPNFKQIKD